MLGVKIPMRPPTVARVVIVAVLTLPGEAAGASRFEAHFAARSYGPGEGAQLLIASAGTTLNLQVFRADAERVRTLRDDSMNGVPVNDPRLVRPGRVAIDLHHWPPGLYYARVRSGTRVTFAPFILRASPVFRPRVAVVLPTNTWQAYNLRDDDGDGIPNSWYASEAVSTVALNRPYRNRGVPPYFRHYDLQFLRWLALTGKIVDYLADDDLEQIHAPAALAARYDLIVFSGHEEYVTTHAFDLIEGYRRLGGNRIFLSANNFFYGVARSGATLTKLDRWRDIGRPEAAFIGVQYVDWFANKHPLQPYVVTGAQTARWLFEQTGLRNGDRFGRYGIEIDARTPESPATTRVLAKIPDAFGPGKTAEMTYHTTPAGAKVFAAGALNFGGSALIPPVPRLLENLWTKLSVP